MSVREDYYNALPAGYCLKQYQIIKVLGAGGFGIAYLATDTRLDTKVVIKEYLPNDLSVREQNTSQILPKDPTSKQDYESGLKEYIKEARTIAKFDHPNIVQVKNYMEANNTAYIVMSYVEGSSLSELAKGETATEEEIRRILFPLLDALKEVHKQGYLHRDIKPSNIFIQQSTRRPILIDFGAARFHLGVRSKSMTSVVTAGYSPYEQYHTKGKQGAWTDIYAMGGVLYRLISGQNPPEAPERITTTMDGEPDPLQLAVDVGKEQYSPALLKAIDYALAIRPVDRPQTVDEWLKVINYKNNQLKINNEIEKEENQNNKGFDEPFGEFFEKKEEKLIIEDAKSKDHQTSIDKEINKKEDLITENNKDKIDKFDYIIGNITTHGGEDLPKYSDFFVQAPKSIGKIITASTSLQKGEEADNSLSRKIISSLVLGIIGLLIGLAINYFAKLSPRNDWEWFYTWVLGLPLLGIVLGILDDPFIHTCNYIGTRGIAKFLMEKNRDNIIEESILKFDDAEALYEKTTNHYDGLYYEKTTYSYKWKDTNGNIIYEILGEYKQKEGNPKKLDDPYYFANSANDSWVKYKLQKMLDIINSGRVVSFVVDNIKINLSTNSIDIYSDEERLKWDISTIDYVDINDGIIQIHGLKDNNEITIG